MSLVSNVRPLGALMKSPEKLLIAMFRDLSQGITTWEKRSSREHRCSAATTLLHVSSSVDTYVNMESEVMVAGTVPDSAHELISRVLHGTSQQRRGTTP